MKSIFCIITTLSILYALNAQSAALDYYWVPGANTNWNTVGNWKIGSFTGSPAAVLPKSVDNIFIGNGSTNATVTLNISDTINNLSIQGTGQIFINTSYGSVLDVLGN